MSQVKYEMEYSFRASPSILYNLLSTSSGMTLWFADNADIGEEECIFTWDGYDDIAYIVENVEDELIRYRWDYMDDDEYFEFRISKSEVTGDTILTVTDFAAENEIEDQKLLWEKQIKNLSVQVGG